MILVWLVLLTGHHLFLTTAPAAHISWVWTSHRSAEDCAGAGVLRCPQYSTSFHKKTSCTMISTFSFILCDCGFKRKEKKKTASQQCSKPDVHTSGYKGGWMLADWLRPPAAAVTILQDVLWTNVCFWLFVALAKKSLIDCQLFQPAYTADVSHPVVKNSPKSGPSPHPSSRFRPCICERVFFQHSD